QKMGSAGEMSVDMVPPTQMCTAPWTPLMSLANGAKSVYAMMVGTLDAIIAKSAVIPGALTTVIVRVGVVTTGSTVVSQEGIDSSSALVQSQYGIDTSG